MGKKIVCIIEDDPVLSNAMQTEFTDAGFEVMHASDGVEGIDVILKKKPDIILLDVLMPKLDGIEVAKRLKNNPETRNIPIIILSVRDKMATIADAISSGVTDYLVKSDVKVADIIKLVQKKLGVGK